MKGPVITFLVGIVVGLLLAVFGGIFKSMGNSDFWTGVGYGVGIGFGSVVALATLNFLVSYVDRVFSGRA